MAKLDYFNADSDDYSEELQSYKYLVDSLEDLFHCYLKDSEMPSVRAFCEEVLRVLKETLNGTLFDGIYVFSFDNRAENELHYVNFTIESDYIEVYSGGSTYDPQVGSDSYSNPKYILGESDVGELAYLIDEAFSLIQSGAKLTIELPEAYIDDIEE